MSWMRKLSLRFDEMLNAPERKGGEQPLEAASEEKQENASDSKTETATAAPPAPEPAPAAPVNAAKQPGKRTKHPKEASFISMSEYGKFQFRFDKPEHDFLTEKGEGMVFHDWYTHGIIFGESGSGKTSFVLNQIYEEMFRCTHLKDGADRDRMKLGGLIVEAKGDFAPKTWDLAVKYGRSDDVILFGPNHVDHIYDPFGDPTESPQQLADKMQAVMDSFSGGEKGADPFWPAASRKLFTQIFYLHKKLREAKVPNLVPMSFSLLNLLLMDRGQPRNQGEIDQKQRSFQETYEKFNTEKARSRNMALRLCLDLGPLNNKIEATVRQLQTEMDEVNQEIQTYPDKSDPAWRRSIAQRKEEIQLRATNTFTLRTIISCEDLGENAERMIPRLERLRKDVNAMDAAQNDMDRGAAYDSIVENSFYIRRVIQGRIGALAEATHIETPEKLLAIRTALLDLSDALEKIQEIGTQLSQWQTPEPVVGMLKRLLMQYEQVLQQRGEDPTLDSVCAYFQEEYLNPANDKTSGSVAMMASNVVNMFIHPPFNKIFSDKGNFSMAQLIDEGKLIALDMPQAKYGVVFNIAALIMKVDFFRAVLSRRVLPITDPATGKSRIVNQDRPLTYLCDEFASVATTGDTTGEAGFLDKCREYKCACILAVQSKPMLLKKLQESEVDAILTNCGIKIFLRNTDEKTTEMASKILGSTIKVSASNTMSAREEAFKKDLAFGARGFTTSYNRTNLFDGADFAKLKNGEAIVKLNPRFGSKQSKKVQFSLFPVKSIDSEGLVPYPIVT